MLLIFSIIGSAQAFELQQIMTDGGPGGASRTVVLYLYTLLQKLRFADATVLGIYLFLAVMAIVVIYRLFFNDDPDAPKRRRSFSLTWPSATSVQELDASNVTSTAAGAQGRETPRA
jgi:hypothetical protein